MLESSRVTKPSLLQRSRVGVRVRGGDGSPILKGLESSRLTRPPPGFGCRKMFVSVNMKYYGSRGSRQYLYLLESERKQDFFLYL